MPVHRRQKAGNQEAMSLLLRITAVLSALWTVVWFSMVAPSISGTETVQPLTESLGDGLAIANLGFAYLFWRAASDPPAERIAIQTALLVLGLRAAKGTYEVLYVLDGAAALAGLAEMVLSIALFVGILNTLPATLRKGI